jgi:SAM-dependent methyltransferase
LKFPQKNWIAVLFGNHFDLFADEFFRVLGAQEYVSVDRSDYEGANFLHDLNEPFPAKMRGQFDFVLDSGTLEHIFNYPAALKNSLELLRVGGHFLTATPANGHMGHGFYQFSPELFFSIFTEQNGFALRKTILYETYREGAPFYEVSSPAKLGNRVELNTSPPVSIVALAQKISEAPIFATPPQQSDYVAAWKTPVLKPDRSNFFRRMRADLNPY